MIYNRDNIVENKKNGYGQKLWKFKEFLENVRTQMSISYGISSSFFKEYCWIAGGSLPCYLNGFEIQDVDIFLKDECAIDELIKTLERHNFNILNFVNKKEDEKYKMIEDEKFVIKTNKALTFSKIRYTNTKNGMSVYYNPQIIINNNFIGSPNVILKYKFDLLHCTWHYDYFTQNLWFSEKIFSSIVEKKLIQNAKTHSYQKRIDKWKSRGYVMA